MTWSQEQYASGRRLRLRASLAVCGLLVAVGSVARGGDPPPTREAEVARTRAEIASDVADLASQVLACGGAETSFVSTRAALNLIRGHAWVLTVWVGDAPDYEAEYFVLSEVDGRRVGEVMHGEGPAKVRRLDGEPLTRYLRATALDATALAALYRRFYAEVKQR